MVCPSRKNTMICKIIQDRKVKTKKNKKIEDKEITKEEHEKRLKMLKDMGMIK